MSHDHRVASPLPSGEAFASLDAQALDERGAVAASEDKAMDEPDAARSITELDSALWSELLDRPYEHDLFMLLRRFDADSSHPPLGRAPRPRDEPLRLGQEPSMAFAPSNVSKVDIGGDGPPRISIYGFGLFGPNGPLPLHLTEYARERQRHHNDDTFSAFADLFHHRLILLFYRAWADAQSVNSLDRPDGHRFIEYVNSLTGMGQPALKNRDSISDHARAFAAGHLGRQVRNPEGLIQVLRLYFGVPAHIEEFVSGWMLIDEPQISRIGQFGQHHRLGMGATLGVAVRDAQARIRIVLGPLTLAQFHDFLPDGNRLKALVDWLRQYVGIELAWDLRLILQREAVQGMCLGGSQRLGWGSWLGMRLQETHADDMVFRPEWLFRRPALR